MLGISIILGAVRMIGPAVASNLGAFIARTVGPYLPVSRVALSNLALAMPELDAAGRQQVMRGAWDNLGRTAAELPHLARLGRTASGPGWECMDDSVLSGLRTRTGPAILFSGHIANWEIGFPVAAVLGLDVSWFYRRASSPLVDTLLQQMRAEATGHAVPMFAKGTAGANAAFRHLRKGGLLGMLVDQKLNEGVAAPFFGQAAMTSTAMAHFALHFRCPVIPIHVVRLGPARFKVVCDRPMSLPDTGDRVADVYAMTLTMNETLERWIREQPQSWLWMHRRWPKPTTLSGAQAG